MWILTAPNPPVVPVYSSTDMERRLVREAHLAEEIGWILTAPNPPVVPVYSSTDMERRLVREAHLAEEIG
jgi:hypothetical protein